MGYDYYVHGLFMWTAWTVFAFFQISSNRYLKGDLKGKHMWIHRVFGLAIMTITLYHGFSAWHGMGWKVIKNGHMYFVFPTLFTVFFLGLAGVVTRSRMRRTEWNTAQALRFKKFH